MMTCVVSKCETQQREQAMGSLDDVETLGESRLPDTNTAGPTREDCVSESSEESSRFGRGNQSLRSASYSRMVDSSDASDIMDGSESASDILSYSEDFRDLSWIQFSSDESDTGGSPSGMEYDFGSDLSDRSIRGSEDSPASNVSQETSDEFESTDFLVSNGSVHSFDMESSDDNNSFGGNIRSSDSEGSADHSYFTDCLLSESASPSSILSGSSDGKAVTFDRDQNYAWGDSEYLMQNSASFSTVDDLFKNGCFGRPDSLYSESSGSDGPLVPPNKCFISSPFTSVHPPLKRRKKVEGADNHLRETADDDEESDLSAQVKVESEGEGVEYPTFESASSPDGSVVAEDDNTKKIGFLKNEIARLDTPAKKAIMECLYRLSSQIAVPGPRDTVDAAASSRMNSKGKKSRKQQTKDPRVQEEASLAQKQVENVVLRMMYLLDTDSVHSPPSVFSPCGSVSTPSTPGSTSVAPNVCVPPFVVQHPSVLAAVGRQPGVMQTVAAPYHAYDSAAANMSSPRATLPAGAHASCFRTANGKSGEQSQQTRKRVFFTEEQTRKLNKYYEELGGVKCSPMEISHMAKDVGITEHQVRIYFQNKRARTRNKKELSGTDDGDSSATSRKRGASTQSRGQVAAQRQDRRSPTTVRGSTRSAEANVISKAGIANAEQQHVSSFGGNEPNIANPPVLGSPETGLGSSSVVS